MRFLPPAPPRAPFLAVVLLGLASCTRGEDEPPPRPKPAAMRDTLYIAVAQEAGHLLPVLSASAADDAVIEALSANPMDGGFDCRVSWSPS